MTDLSGLWTLPDASGTQSIPFPLPGGAISARPKAGMIPDPCRGRSEDGLRPAAARDRVAAGWPDHNGTAADFAVDRPDRVARITLNGYPGPSAASAFRRFRADWAGLRAGKDQICILFRSNLRAADALQAALPFRLPYHNGNRPVPKGNMLRKGQSDFGRHWNRAGVPFGLCGRTALASKGPRTEGVGLTRTLADGMVTMRVPVHTGYGIFRATLSCLEENAQSADGVARLSFRIAGAELWCPAGPVAQVLHGPAITAGTATARRRAGLRRPDPVCQAEAAGRSFGVRENGHLAFTRGSDRIGAGAPGADGTAPGRNIPAPPPWKGHDLKTPKITRRIPAAPGGRAIGMTAGHPASFVVPQADRPGRFSHTAFAPLPGRDAAITFVPEAPGPAPCFTLRDLHSATHGAPQPQEF